MDVIEANGVNGQMSFDGQFVTITRKGGMARLTVGKGAKRIPVRSITAIQWKPPSKMMRGFIQFTIAGGNETRSRLGKQTADAAKDENSVLFSSGQQEAFEVLRRAVDAAISSPTTTVSGSTADELKKIAALRDAGVLTDVEFAAQKARLLG